MTSKPMPCCRERAAHDKRQTVLHWMRRVVAREQWCCMAAVCFGAAARRLIESTKAVRTATHEPERRQLKSDTTIIDALRC